LTGDWVAVAVRGRGLAGRRLGRDGIHRLGRLPSLAAAVAELARTPYGREVRAGMDLRAAQHGIYATLAWHLRILAGWAPAQGADGVRRLAAGLEIANVIGRLAQLTGRPSQPAYKLGALAIGWSRVAAAASPKALRQALISSAWGDPGTEDLAGVRMALEAAWARRVTDGVPEARTWSSGFAALLVARALAAGTSLVAHDVARRHVGTVLGRGWENAATFGALAAHVPRATAWLFEGITAPDDLWRAELRWWRRLETDGLSLCATPQPRPGIVVGLVALLAADAWQTCGALERAARGGMVARDFDEVA